MFENQRDIWHDGLESFDEDERLAMKRGVCFGKGGGGSAPAPPTEQTVTQTNLPDYAEPFFTRLLERTEAESNVPYISYGGQRIAEFDPYTQQGIENVASQAGAGTPGQVGTATSLAEGVGQYQSQAFPANAAAYMDPYTRNVLDVQEDMLTRRFNEQQGARQAAAVEAGAFGGDRQAIAEQQAQRDLNEQLNAMQAEGLRQAYTTGADIFARDEQARQAAMGLGLGASQQLGQLGGLEQQMGFERADQLMRAGAMRQGQEQAGLDVAYQDFINQRDFPRQQLNFYSSILRGVPISAQSEVSSYQAPPNPYSQLMGMGLGAAGLYKAFGGGG